MTSDAAVGLSPRCLAEVSSVCGSSADCSSCVYTNWATISQVCSRATESIVAANACSPSPAPAPKPALTALHISWPTANVEAMVTYFEGTLSGTKVSQTSVNGTTTYYGKLFAADSLELRWEQSSQATQGPTTVAEWEAYTAGEQLFCLL